MNEPSGSWSGSTTTRQEFGKGESIPSGTRLEHTRLPIRCLLQHCRNSWGTTGKKRRSSMSTLLIPISSRNKLIQRYNLSILKPSLGSTPVYLHTFSCFNFYYYVKYDS